jgi:hypothetical protein
MKHDPNGRGSGDADGQLGNVHFFLPGDTVIGAVIAIALIALLLFFFERAPEKRHPSGGYVGRRKRRWRDLGGR